MKVNIRPHATWGGDWYTLDWRPNGAKGGRERLHIKGRAEAEERAAEIAGIESQPHKVTFPRLKDVVAEYLSWCQRNQAPATYKDKTYCFKNRIIPHFGSYRPRDLTQKVYDEFGTKYATHRRAVIMYQDYLGAMIKWMVKRRMAEPLKFRPEKPKYHLPSHSIRDVTDLDLFIAAVPGIDKQMILTTILWTGLRWNEAINLRWEDVNLQRSEIIVKESNQEEQATVRIAPDMREWFAANHKAAGWIFPNPRTGQPYGSLKTCMATAAKKTGISITPHDIRRTAAMMVYEATGGDILSVQRFLRHKDIKTTVRYLECSGVRMGQAIDSMVEHIAGKRSKAGGQVDSK